MASSISSAAPPSARPITSTAQQAAALNHLLAKYRSDLSRGITGGTLSSLGRQIMTAAQNAGEHVSLPRASGPAAQSAKPVLSAALDGKVDLTA